MACARVRTDEDRSLNARGLGGVRLVISDAHTGLIAAIQTVFAGASWQRFPNPAALLRLAGHVLIEQHDERDVTPPPPCGRLSSRHPDAGSAVVRWLRGCGPLPRERHLRALCKGS